MIAVSSSGKSFRSLASYLVNGRTGKEQDRVAWTVSRNLPTRDPELAATFMRATAAQSDRVEKPVYHIALSFAPGDPVDRTTMERVATRLLEQLGLAQHQAVVVAHRDRGHAHVHILVNRVHPETGKAWERWQDQPVIQQVLREEERALGLREVAPSLLPREQQSPKSTSRVAAVAQMVKAYEQLVGLIRERNATELAIAAARSSSAEAVRVEDRAKACEIEFQRALARVFVAPDRARQEFARVVEFKGANEAVELLRHRPGKLGPLRAVERPRALGFMHTHDHQQAEVLSRQVAVKGREALEAERAKGKFGLEVGCSPAEAELLVRRSASLAADLGRLPKRRELEHQIGKAMSRLLPREVERLKLLITGPQIGLVQRLRATAKDVLLGKGQEQG